MLFWVSVVIGVIWGGTFILAAVALIGSRYSTRIRRIFSDD